MYVSDYWSSLASSLCWTEPNTGCATDCLVADKDEAAVSFPPLHAAERWEYTNYLLSGAQVQVHHLGTDIYMIIIFSSYSLFLNQNIRMISELSCDSEDWSNDAENSALPSQEITF